jgi:hypothetical protein
VRERRRLIVIVEVVTLCSSWRSCGALAEPGPVAPELRRREADGLRLSQRRHQDDLLPALRPRFAGGYINYYYYGFVLAAVPTAARGRRPWPTTDPADASLTAIGAFSAAYNLVAYGRERAAERGEPDEDELPEAAHGRLRSSHRRRAWRGGACAGRGSAADGLPLDGLPPDRAAAAARGRSWLQIRPRIRGAGARGRAAANRAAANRAAATELPASAPASAPAETAIAEMAIAEPASAETPAAEVAMAEAPAEEAPAAEPVVSRGVPRP